MKLNEISQKTLASYIEKSGKRLASGQDKDTTKPLKGSKIGVTSKVDNKADELSKKLQDKGKSTEFLKSFTNKPKTDTYTFKGQQWVSDKGKIAKKEVGAQLSKQSISDSGGYNKASERLKGIQQAAKRIQDKDYQRQDKINTVKSKLKGFAKTVVDRTQRDMPKAKAVADTIKDKANALAQTISTRTKRDIPKAVAAGQTVKDKAKALTRKVIDNAVVDTSIVKDAIKNKIKSKMNKPKATETKPKTDSEKDIFTAHNKKVQDEENAKKAQEKWKAQQKEESKWPQYKVDVHHKSKFLGRPRIDTIEVKGKNHYHALERARNMMNDGDLRSPRIGEYRRVK
jgi:hypothetical protein